MIKKIHSWEFILMGTTCLNVYFSEDVVLRTFRTVSMRTAGEHPENWPATPDLPHVKEDRVPSSTCLSFTLRVDSAWLMDGPHSWTGGWHLKRVKVIRTPTRNHGGHEDTLCLDRHWKLSYLPTHTHRHTGRCTHTHNFSQSRYRKVAFLAQ